MAFERNHDDTDARLRRGAEALARSHPAIDRGLIERIVFDSRARLSSGRDGDLVVDRALDFAGDRVRALAGPRAAELVVLVVSIRNDGVSQIAAAYLESLSDGRVRAHSAAVSPVPEVLRTVVDVMDEVGVPLVDGFPKPIAEELVRSADVIVRMLVDVPFEPLDGQSVVDWEAIDPAGRSTEEVRAIRDRVRASVVAFLAERGLTSAR